MKTTLDYSAIAQMSPKRILTKRFFYLPNYRFLIASLVGLGVLIALLFKFLYVDILSTGTNMQLWEVTITVSVYLLIIFFFIVAVKTIADTLARIEVEHAYARRMEVKCEEVTNERPNKKYEGNLENIEKFLVENTHYDSAMYRMFGYVHSEAKNRQFHSTYSTTQLYREECEMLFDKAASYQRSVLQLGILGTFIGLIISFSKFNNIKIDDNVFKEIIGTLQYAFSTSIIGLVAAIILGVILLFLQKKKEQYFIDMEKTASSFTSVVYSAKNTSTDYKVFRNVSDAINLNTVELSKQQKQIKGLTKSIKAGMNALNLKSEEFDSFLKNISKAELSYLEKMQRIYDVLSPQTISEELNTKLKEATFKYFEETNAKYTELNSTILKTNDVFKTLDNKIDLMSNNIGKTVEEQQRFISELTESHATKELVRVVEEASEKLGNELNSNIKNINLNLKSNNENLNKFHQDSHVYIGINKKNRNIQLLFSGVIVLLFVAILLYTLHSMNIIQ